MHVGPGIKSQLEIRSKIDFSRGSKTRRQVKIGSMPRQTAKTGATRCWLFNSGSEPKA